MRKSINDSFDKLKKSDTMWLDKDGELHSIASMDCKHIYYTVQMLKRENKKIKKYNKNLPNHYKRKKYKIPNLMLERYEKCKEIIPEYYI